eukprot:8051497-Alexandrium_andersonii.AAC.1
MPTTRLEGTTPQARRKAQGECMAKPWAIQSPGRGNNSACVHCDCHQARQLLKSFSAAEHTAPHPP